MPHTGRKAVQRLGRQSPEGAPQRWRARGPLRVASLEEKEAEPQEDWNPELQ
jgi:hypothetical protein